MEVRFLGAHNCESVVTRCVSILVDGVLALDAGGLTSGLSFVEQWEIKAVFLTHHHYDHVRDVPALAMNYLLQGERIELYSTRETHEILAGHLLDGVLYPDFRVWPEHTPALKYNILSEDDEVTVGGYRIRAVAVKHAVPALGYQITSPDGKVLFYSGDTGPGLETCFEKIIPQILILEVSSPNRFREFALEKGHLTPELLQQELRDFHKLKDYLPRVVLVHMNPFLEEEITREIAVVSRELVCDIMLATEGMRLNL